MMLSFNNHAGILLIGYYTSLKELHKVVHDVNDRLPLIKEEDGPFLAWAYEVRKAYEQQLEILSPPEDHKAKGLRYGVEILWPVLLLQQRMLKVSLGHIDYSRKHQAITSLTASEKVFDPHGVSNR